MADNNAFPGENNTGHIWDADLRELSNPPPQWWMIAFWASMFWVVAYGFLYPFIPLANSSTPGLMGWTQMKEYQEGVAEVEAVRAPFENKISSMSAKQILADPGLADYTVASAKVLFGDNCGACHGKGGQGGPGFPVIADDDWLFGGSVETIVKTITSGRQGMMPAHGKMLSAAEVDTLAQAVMSGKVASERLFRSKGCSGCHGAAGKGVPAMGSANLTDAIWRFKEADQLAGVKATIMHGVNDSSDPDTRVAQMPAFGDRLSKDEIKKLAVYVHKLGGGQ